MYLSQNYLATALVRFAALFEKLSLAGKEPRIREKMSDFAKVFQKCLETNGLL